MISYVISRRLNRDYRISSLRAGMNQPNMGYTVHYLTLWQCCGTAVPFNCKFDQYSISWSLHTLKPHASELGAAVCFGHSKRLGMVSIVLALRGLTELHVAVIQ